MIGAGGLGVGRSVGRPVGPLQIKKSPKIGGYRGLIETISAVSSGLVR
jgi:hypothetical protein